ncbi:Cacna1h [Symbiodinium pilosum]|uniref:Cacna1h protein n=1 Tax=Symbiodinium pilosum TaxID=2952 RepID=A0A812TAP7_SYMPI|nr:Cacna1h [Symbiodinium pilosum]
MMWMNYADLLVSLVSAVEVISSLLVIPVSPVLVRILRLGKLARVLRLVSMGSVLQSLQLLLKSLVASIDMLFWSFCLLAFLQCVAGLIISTFCREYIGDDSHDQVQREEVFKYFGTFTRTFLTMFEVLFANWGPPCRVLVENISEWFSVFFLLYRCVIGFAVLNVVGAVFIQQTLKTANSDEELAYRQKEKEIQSYTRKVRKLFQSMDDSGDGALNLEEFSKLVTSPKLSFWMSQLELEYHDLLSLFEFLDNGDGQITLQEFIEGSARFRGGAKALDIWRLETKVEVLFEEMLNLMHTNDSEVSSYVQRAFNESAYSHIKSALRKDTP